jgi:hypothetical protein
MVCSVILAGEGRVSKNPVLEAFKMGIRKLGYWKVFGDEGFGECRTYDIGF